MIVPTRLYDFLDKQVERFDLPDAMAAKEEGQWRLYSSKAVFDTCQKLSAGLLSLGVSGGDGSPEAVDKIAIISNNRPEWLITDMACQQIGAVLCPIYPTTNPAEIEFIFNDAAVKYVLVSSDDLLQKVQAIAPRIPSLKGIYTFNKIAGAAHWSTILDQATPALEAEVSRIKNAIPPSQIATIIYTSGTTGTPKGVMLSHHNIVSNVLHAKSSFPFDDAPGKKVLSFLPLNHIFERTVSYIYLASGLSIYYAESLDTIGENLKEIKPNGFTTVPRLLEKVYEKIMSKGEELAGLKRKLFFWSVDLGLRFDSENSGYAFYRFKLSIARKLIFSKWKAGLGGNIEFIITGGAACQERLLRVFNAAGIPVYEGYGPTENSPVVSVNRQGTGGNRFGTVGPPLDGQAVKLAEDGEILVKGSSVMMGYYKRPDLTAEVLKDGWLLTGDIGVWVDNRFLKITDRKKELFKTSGGKYVAPQPIENKLKESVYVEQVLVVGAERKFVGALIVPAFGALREWMRQNQIAFTTNDNAIMENRVQQHYRTIVDGFNVSFNHVEQIKRFELMPREWSIESGEMTPKMSLKRKVIMEKYRTAIDRIYN